MVPVVIIGGARMASRFTGRQKQALIGVPIGVLVFSALAYYAFGLPALVLPPVLMGAFVAWLVVENRHFQVDLFVRALDEQRAGVAQVEAIVGLTQVLRPRVPFPGTRGWAASPDLLREVVTHILSTPTTRVVEASSGTSTLLIAYAMQHKGSGHVIALEHDALYAGRTRRLLELHGLGHRATVVHAPLVTHRTDHGELLWYDLSGVTFEAPIDLLLVDGPPESVGPLARYPAVPLLRRHFAAGTRVILDDGAREDERRIAERWRTEMKATACEYLELEKGGWSLYF